MQKTFNVKFELQSDIRNDKLNIGYTIYCLSVVWQLAEGEKKLFLLKNGFYTKCRFTVHPLTICCSLNILRYKDIRVLRYECYERGQSM